jgi:hypothetical protein
MNSWLVAVYRCLCVDAVKLRRTPALALAVFLPALPPLMFFVYALQYGNKGTPEGVTPMAWTVQGILSLWGMFLLPLFAAIETSLLAGIEWHNSGWKYLFTLPVPRSAVYTAKFIAAGSLMGIATISISGYTIVSNWGLIQLRTDAGFVGPLPIWQTLVLFALVGVVSLVLLAVHSFVALRWPSFALNVGLALAALLGDLVLLGSRLRFLYPWSLPPMIENLAGPMVFGWGSRSSPSDLTKIVFLALVGAGLLTILGVWRLSAREVP